MKTTLVGYTGFVGSNLAAQHKFDALYNSKNIQEAFGEPHDLVIYAGVRAEKFLANNDPASDKAAIEQTESIIERLNPKKLVLISTIDVYKSPVGVSESSSIETEGLHAYGLHRYELENWVRKNIASHSIIRLPALFGENLKKNFIFDMIQIVPTMLRTELWNELSKQSPLVKTAYESANNGFYKLIQLDSDAFIQLRAFFSTNEFNALKFTDSRNEYQFYDLSNLYLDIQKVIQNELPLVNLAVPPIQAGRLFSLIFGRPFENPCLKEPVKYNMRTEYASLMGGSTSYICDTDRIQSDIEQFVKSKLSKFKSQPSSNS
jgi:hypothetical protein